MGYLHIENLYKNNTVLEFEEVYALEKIHGTSAHIKYASGKPLTFFSGGEKYENFCQLFDVKNLTLLFESLGQDNITVYGEAYGGKQQGMRATYGDSLKFIIFDVHMNGNWLDVETAATLTKYLKLEFVDYKRIKCTIEELDTQRDADSTQAVRNGVGEGKKREGIVIRPIKECVDERGNRIIAKHKRADFQETKTPRKVVDLDKLKVLKEAHKIAEEWVTPNRLAHVIDRVKSALNAVQGLESSYKELGIEDTKDIVIMMTEDVIRESKGEIVESQEVRKAIGKAAARLYIQSLQVGGVNG